MKICRFCDVAFNNPTLMTFNMDVEPKTLKNKADVGNKEVDGWYLNEHCKIIIPEEIWSKIFRGYQSNKDKYPLNMLYVFFHTKTGVYVENVNIDVYFQALMMISYLTEEEYYAKCRELKVIESSAGLSVGFDQDKFWRLLRYILKERKGVYSDEDILLSVDDIKFFIKESTT